MVVVVVVFSSFGGFTTVVFSTFFSAGGVTTVFSSQAANTMVQAGIINMKVFIGKVIEVQTGILLNLQPA